MTTDREDRLLNDKPWRHYRRRYSTAEVKWGVVVLAGLALVAGWVVWMGAHPDPELFAAAPPQASRDPAGADRGALPDDLATDGWSAGPVRRYGPENVYEKINGREGYYKAFGFRSLTCVSLEHDAPGRSIDVELYDQGEPENALGAYAGELAPDAAPQWVDGGFVHYTSNALFLTRGGYYARALGSDRSPAVRAQLEHLERRLVEALPAGELPWAYALFARALDLGPGRVSFVKENAFSFGFAERVWVGLLPDDETEVFVVHRPDDAEAAAGEFQAGFAAYGEPVEDAGAAGAWVADRYLGRVSAARAQGELVYGVRGAATATGGAALLERLAAQLPRDVAAVPTDDEEPGETVTEEAREPSYEGASDGY